jgi:hypothetical protein
MRSSIAELAADVATLLRSGRTAVALAQLEKLPRLIRDEVTDRLGATGWRAYRDGYERGRADLSAEIAGLCVKRAKKPTNAEWLRERVADPAMRARAKATLRLDDKLLDRVLEGGVGLSPTSWRELRKELGR